METHVWTVRTVLSRSEQIYRNVAGYSRSTIASLDRNDLHHDGHLIRDISASLYQIHLILSTAQDDDDSTSQENFDLYHIQRCQRLLDDLDQSISLGHLDCLHGRPSEGKQTDPLVRDLSHLHAQLVLAVAADTPFALLRVLSQPKMLTVPGQATFNVHLPDRVPSGHRRDITTVRGIPNPAAVAQWSDSRLNTYLRLRTPGSLDLTLQHLLIQDWLGGRVARLWLHGERGTGKTILASAILEQLIHQTRNDPTTAVCYHIFDQPKRWGAGSNALLAGLIGQLAQQNPDAQLSIRVALTPDLLPARLPQWLEDSPNGGIASSREQADYLGHIFKTIEAMYERLYIVIDGIDEGGVEIMEALAILHNYVRASTAYGTPVTSMLVLSREPPDAKGDFRIPRARYKTLDITPDPSQIKLYVKNRLQEHRQVRSTFSDSSKEGERIVEAIGSATRLFEVAELQIDYLLSLTSEAERNVALLKLPTELQKMYSLFIARLTDPYERDLVHTTLRWLQELGPDELDMYQLCEGIAIFLAKGAESLADVPAVTQAQILRLCGGLVRRTLDGSTIELAHQSVQEMLSAHTLDARCEIGIACLRLLNLRDFACAPKEFRLEQGHSSRRDASHPFYQYATEAWMDVLPGKDVEEALEEVYMKEACQLFTSLRSGNLVSWLLEVGKRIFDAALPLSPAQIFICLTTVCTKYRLSSTHIAACFGLSRVCSALVQGGLDINARCELGTPLYCALAGPVLLLFDGLNIDWGIARKMIRLESRLDTAEKLMELGAQPDSVPWRPDTHLSFPAVALMACAARSGSGDVRLFTSLCPDGQYLEDDHFYTIFQDRAFPFEPSNSGSSDDPVMPHQKQFLDDLCILLIDQSWKNRISRIWATAWKKGIDHNLQCTSPATRRRLPLDDEAFAKAMTDALQTGSEVDIRYCMQDTRWNANLPLTGVAEEDRGRTLLHRAVEEGDASLVRLLLECGRVDVSVSDASGRTPLHLCERSDVLRLLVGSGADLHQVDNDGRLLWHYAAANNDILLLRTLLALDPDTEWVFKQTTKQGRTPLAEALAYVRELNGLPTVPPGQYRQFLTEKTQSIRFILDRIGYDTACLRSDIPIVCYAAEWGTQWMVRTLRGQFPVLEVATKDGSGPLHFLNFHASSELIREIKEISGVIDLPVLNSDGRSPAETIFRAFKPSIEEPNDNAHPSNNAALDRIAYMELLTEEVCKSRDEQGRTLWERFCRDVVLFYAAKKVWPRVADAITVAVSCFVERGVVREYETLSGHCAFFELLRMICGDFTRVGMPSWLPAIYLQLIRATTSMKIQLLKDDPGINSFLQLMQRRDAFEYRELFTVLDSMGIPIVNSPG